MLQWASEALQSTRWTKGKDFSLNPKLLRRTFFFFFFTYKLVYFCPMLVLFVNKWAEQSLQNPLELDYKSSSGVLSCSQMNRCCSHNVKHIIHVNLYLIKQLTVRPSEQHPCSALMHWKQIYLKRILIQDSGAKNSYTIGVNTGMITPAQGLGQLLLTVDNDGHSLLLNTDAYTMPPVRNKKSRWLQTQQTVKGRHTWDVPYFKTLDNLPPFLRYNIPEWTTFQTSNFGLV